MRVKVNGASRVSAAFRMAQRRWREWQTSVQRYKIEYREERSGTKDVEERKTERGERKSGEKATKMGALSSFSSLFPLALQYLSSWPNSRPNGQHQHSMNRTMRWHPCISIVLAMVAAVCPSSTLSFSLSPLSLLSLFISLLSDRYPLLPSLEAFRYCAFPFVLCCESLLPALSLPPIPSRSPGDLPSWRCPCRTLTRCRCRTSRTTAPFAREWRPSAVRRRRERRRGRSERG